MNKTTVIRGVRVNIYHDLRFVAQVGNIEEFALTNPRVAFCKRITTYLNVFHIGWVKMELFGES